MIATEYLTPGKSFDQATQAMLALFDNVGYVLGKPRAVIKPNMVDAMSPLEAVDTNPFVVGGLVLALADRGAEEILVGDGSAYFSNEERTWNRLLEESGYTAMRDRLASDHGIVVTLVNLVTAPREPYPWKFGALQLPSLCRSHEYIDIAKMKTHVITQVSMALKNQNGLITLADKKAFHMGKKYGSLHECINELGLAVRPDLAIVDGTRALGGSGPTSAPDGQTKVRHPKVLIGGMDAFEVDTAACQVMGIPVSDVKHLIPVEVTLADGSQPLVPVDPPFARPKPWVLATTGFYIDLGEKCCTGCQMARSRMFRKISFAPEIKRDFARFRHEHDRVDFIMGAMETDEIEAIRENGGTLVFFGNCTKKLAEQNNALHIAGCPPDHNEAIRQFLGEIEGTSD
jgi:uncharacterized protein (DUF362 family)